MSIQSKALLERGNHELNGSLNYSLSLFLIIWQANNESVVVLRKLLPNTEYVVHVSITNHYLSVGNTLPNITLENADIFSTDVGGTFNSNITLFLRLLIPWLVTQ